MEVLKSNLRKFQNYDLAEKELDSFESKINDELMNQSYEHFKLSEQLSTELFVPGSINLITHKRKEIMDNLPHINEKSRAFKKRKLVFGVAACISLLIMATIFIKSNVPMVDLQQLASSAAAESINIDHISTVERGTDAGVKDELFDLYVNGKYEDFLAKIKNSENSQYMRLLEGRAMMKLGNHQEANAVLNQININTFPQRDALLWSLVEVELFLNHKELAHKYLAQIVTNQYPNADKAKLILTDLD